MTPAAAVGLKAIGQSLHILPRSCRSQEKLKKSADRHVGDRIELVELDTMASPEFFRNCASDRLCLGGRKAPTGLQTSSRREAAIGTAIPEFIQELKGLDGFLKDPSHPAAHRSGWRGNRAAKRRFPHDARRGTLPSPLGKGGATQTKLHRSITWRPNARLCSTSQRKLGLSSGAPPVISTVGISVLARVRMHCSAVSLDMLRSGQAPHRHDSADRSDCRAFRH